MSPRGPDLIVAGVAARALALSAVRAGRRVLAVDAFGDLDLRAAAEVIALRRDTGGFDALEAAHAVRDVAAPAVAYTSNLENHPGAVALLARGRHLLGNPASVLRRVRNPLRLATVLRQLGFPTPATRASAPDLEAPRRSWLVKPRRSGGGHGTEVWRRGRLVSRRFYLQERVSGTPGSIVFLADGRRAMPLALSAQLVGRGDFGARGFRYCGSLVGPGLFEQQELLGRRAAAVAEAVTSRFGLRGLNGIDFIARRGVPWPIEVNPRYCASMELIERAGGGSLFELHARACAGELPRELPETGAGLVQGKAVVFARRRAMVSATRSWLEDPALADIPHPGECFERGRPICTVFAAAPNMEECYRTLVARANAIYRAVEPRARGAA